MSRVERELGDEVFDLLREFMAGFVLEYQGEPVAVQVLYKAVAPRWISVEFVNGGVAPVSPRTCNSTLAESV